MLVDDLDPLARAAWLAADDLPPSRPVTIDDVTATARAQRGCTFVATGSGATWRATIEATRRTSRASIDLAIDTATGYVTIEAALDNNKLVDTLAHQLAEIAGALGLVVDDAAVAVYVPRRR